jgi:uncharacterized protein YecE (DUF72 family)
MKRAQSQLKMPAISPAGGASKWRADHQYLAPSSKMPTKGIIHIGASGWDYAHWKGLFYPAGMPRRTWLGYYADHFNTVEINSSFYRLPTKETVEKWKATVGAGFYFCPKISRFITHAKKLNDPEAGLPRFFDVFGPVVDRLGPVLIQLPAVLGFHEEKARKFFQYLWTKYRGFQFALEARHAGWTEPAAAALLKKYHIGWVIADSGMRFPSAELVTANHIYLRFHGPDGSYATSYSRQTLADYAEKCRRWKEAGHTVWAFFNNDLHGYAIANAKTLKEMTV